MGKEVTETEEVTEVIDESELVDSVQAKLDILNGDTDDTDDDNTDDDEGSTEESGGSEESEEKGEAETQADEEESTPDETGDDDDTSQADDTESTPGEEEEQEVTLSDAYYRAAVHQGWAADDIKEFFEAKPELAIKTFAKIYESTNKLSADFASLGRASVKASTETAASKSSDDTSATADSTQLAAIKEEYGADSSIAKMLESMQGQIASGKVEASTQQNAAVESKLDEATATMIDQFFSDPSMKVYAEFYGEGKDAEKFTQGQMKKRWDVLEMAESIVLGAQAQGRDITAGDAMDLAHLSISEPVREKAMRSEFKAKMVKRSKGLTLKPAKVKQVQPDQNAKLSEEQLEAKVSAGLKIFR